MSDSKALDARSREIIKTDLRTNILVEAGAGSGKTQMLAARMAAGVADGVYAIEHMAAVTFTRKAASELRGRFHLALEAALAEALNEKSVEKAARLQAALSNLERFFAGTIHSFCARLLRERPVESGVSPGFTELDEVQDLELRQRTWREFIAAAREAGDPDVADLLDAGIKLKDLDNAFAKVCENDDVEFPEGEGVCPDPKAAAKALTAFWTKFRTFMPSPVADDHKCGLLAAGQSFEGQWRVAQKRLHKPSVVAQLLAVWDRDSKIVMKWWSDDESAKQKIRDKVGALHTDFHTKVVEPYLSAWRQYVYKLSIRLLTRARTSASDERRRLNMLNYGDLLQLTARVLRENLHVRRALQRKYRYLLVDEFQDTDPVQAEIVFWLGQDLEAKPSKRDPKDWRKVPLRPGALFVVGDPKQSIYRFRRADIGIYNTVREAFDGKGGGKNGGEVLPLTLNFRSGKALCEWANEVFSTMFPAEADQHAPGFARLDAAPRQGKAGEVRTLVCSCDKPGEIMERDASAIARYIRTEVDAGRRQFSDFLILTRKKTGRITPYADALEALDIPVEVSGAGAFGESGEVETITRLLRSLADPQDQLALVAVLRGPLFGISDQELYAFKAGGGYFSYFGPRDGKPGDGRVGEALEAMHRYFRWTRVLPAPGALDRILEDTGYLALAATTPGGVDAGDVLHAVDRVRQVVETGGSLSDAADALEADREATSEIESLPLEPGRTNVVRLMNLHKAKGLEAAVVFLADPQGGVKPRADIHIERDGLQARGWMKIVRKSDTSWAETLLGQHADWDTHEDAELPYVDAEENRLLYVAATRARELLVVSRWTKKPAEGAWGALSEFLKDAKELKVPKDATVSPTKADDCSDAARAAAEQSRSEGHSRVDRPSWSITSATAEAHHIARMTPTEEVAPDDPSSVVVANTPSHRADAGQAWGTLIHGLLEHAMRHQNVTAADLRRLGMWLTVEEPQLRDVLDVAVETVLHVAKAGFWPEAKAAEHSVESPFAFTATGSAVMTGVIDLFFQRGDATQVIDYKTDFDVAANAAAYEVQLKTYGQALAKSGVVNVLTSLKAVRRLD